MTQFRSIINSLAVTTKPSTKTDLRDARLFADFSHNCARIPNISEQNLYPIKDVINFSRLSGWDSFKTCYFGSSKVGRLVTCEQSELCHLCAFAFPDWGGYCEYTFNWPIKNSNSGQQANGHDKCPTDLRFLMDRWSAWVHSFDWLFVIYKQFDFEDFLKESSHT